MATLKVYDGTQWQVVAGQGSPGQGVPAGGAAGAFLAKNSAANLDTMWTDSIMRWVGAALCIGTAPTSMDSTAVRLRVNANSALTNSALQVTPTSGSHPAADFMGAPAGQFNAIVGVRVGGQMPWFIDRYGYPKQFVQAGTSVVTTDAGGAAWVYFPEPFNTIPVVVCNETSDIRAFAYPINANTQTNAFLVRVVYYHGGYVNGGVRINWMAYETRTP